MLSTDAPLSASFDTENTLRSQYKYWYLLLLYGWQICHGRGDSYVMGVMTKLT